MFERESTLNEAVPVEEKFPPVTEINKDAIKMLSETTMLLSVIINDISGRKQDESTEGRNPPHCMLDQAELIAKLASDAMRMARDIKGMITA